MVTDYSYPAVVDLIPLIKLLDPSPGKITRSSYAFLVPSATVYP